uniref:Uncharacterized protein AlNc14C146G7395 n=1 Tax=Albugo laibachii Nc14 TaxID=890382 RepID=F0WLK8_9STRA|nr:conserved hypothetical protein [Albugo laibachii Nc14]|eukprot:CCA22172.1 conserved hypothetical protein [Albugo laibachii Nc14]
MSKIENVPSSITDRQISMAFRIYGPIVDIHNRSTANETAIVIFEQEQHALRAVQRTNRSIFYGRKIKTIYRKSVKTGRICANYRRGRCQLGSHCKYVAFIHTIATLTRILACRSLHQLPDGSFAPQSTASDTNSAASETKSLDKVSQCFECEKAIPHAVGVRCHSCQGDDKAAMYCVPCDLSIHSSCKAMQKHTRQYQMVSEQTFCNECQITTITPTIWCGNCEALYCSSCDSKAHQFKATRNHKRESLQAKTFEDPHKLKYVETTPKLALSSESESEIEEAPQVKEAPIVKKRQHVGTTPIHALSSESESEIEEAPIVKMAKQPKVSKNSTHAPVKRTSESESVVEGGPKAKKARNSSKSRLSKVSENSTHTLVKRMEAYHASSSTLPMHLSPSLNSFERLLAHDCAERLGLEHCSTGQGLDRHVVISK